MWASVLKELYSPHCLRLIFNNIHFTLGLPYVAGGFLGLFSLARGKFIQCECKSFGSPRALRESRSRGDWKPGVCKIVRIWRHKHSNKLRLLENLSTAGKYYTPLLFVLFAIFWEGSTVYYRKIYPTTKHFTACLSSTKKCVTVLY